MKRFIRTALAMLPLTLLLTAGAASAQTNWGPRAGLSVDPDQLVVGFHVEYPAATNLYFVPNADVAFGDNVFTFSLNGDLSYRIPGSSARPYVGGGLSYLNYSFDGGGSGDELSLNVLGGFWANTGGSTPFFLEGKLYFADATPDFKVMVGVNL